MHYLVLGPLVEDTLISCVVMVLCVCVCVCVYVCVCVFNLSALFWCQAPSCLAFSPRWRAQCPDADRVFLSSFPLSLPPSPSPSFSLSPSLSLSLPLSPSHSLSLSLFHLPALQLRFKLAFKIRY